MLTIIIEGDESFNETDNTFHYLDSVTVELEHSLISLSKWESKYEVPFLAPGKKESEEVYYYIKCMLITPEISPEVLDRCSASNIQAVQEYIDSKQSATTFGFLPEKKGPGETVTAELIYYWMTAFNIPFECQYWHLNRLLNLIKICNIKNSKPKNMSRHEIAERNRALNAQRREAWGTRG